MSWGLVELCWVLAVSDDHGGRLVTRPSPVRLLQKQIGSFAVAASKKCKGLLVGGFKTQLSNEPPRGEAPLPTAACHLDVEALL